MPGEMLSLMTIKGSAFDAGRRYGRDLATRIVGYCAQEVKPSPKRLEYARRCWPSVEEHAPASAQFMRGMAAGARLTLDHLALLALHEEVYLWEEHCTAFVGNRVGCGGGRTLVAMNWDWGTALYPWAGLLRLGVRGWPRMLTYHFPGLWAGAGINEAGLAFMWTGAGGFPLRKQPSVGVPTYVLISELLRRSSVAECVTYIEQTPRAGAFIFFLGDASGDIAVIEGMPGRVAVQRDQPTICRANHYQCAALVRQSKQKVSPHKGTTLYRSQRMREMVDQQRGRISVAAAKRILTDREGDWPWIHQWPITQGSQAGDLKSMTVDSLIADCGKRVLHTCRGGARPGPWQAVEV